MQPSMHIHTHQCTLTKRIQLQLATNRINIGSLEPELQTPKYAHIDEPQKKNIFLCNKL